MCLEDFMESATHLRIPELSDFLKGGELALDVHVGLQILSVMW